MGLNRDSAPVQVHVGGCWNRGKRTRGISRAEAAGLNRDSAPVQVHVGGCWNRGKRTRGISRAEARQAIVEGIRPCGACRPDSALGLLD
ncbi:DUF6233 domain-containing protein [Streptomyces sp. WAC 04229]|uniref:DUF6233 domain-containing protein n=1 Tax=Streptomyces sp. WAC 04229 TaxID=2203206 RepID=UPI003D75C83C